MKAMIKESLTRHPTREQNALNPNTDCLKIKRLHPGDFEELFFRDFAGGCPASDYIEMMEEEMYTFFSPKLLKSKSQPQPKVIAEVPIALPKTKEIVKTKNRTRNVKKRYCMVS